MNSPLYFPVALVHWESSNWISLSSHICLNRSGRISIKDWKNQSDEMVFSPLSLPFTVRTIHTSPVDYACLNVDPLTLLNVSGSSWSVHHCSAVSSLGASGGCSFLTASGFDLWSLFFFSSFFFFLFNMHERNINSYSLWSNLPETDSFNRRRCAVHQSVGGCCCWSWWSDFRVFFFVLFFLPWPKVMLWEWLSFGLENQNNELKVTKIPRVDNRVDSCTRSHVIHY